MIKYYGKWGYGHWEVSKNTARGSISLLYVLIFGAVSFCLAHCDDFVMACKMHGIFGWVLL